MGYLDEVGADLSDIRISNTQVQVRQENEDPPASGNNISLLLQYVYCACEGRNVTVSCAVANADVEDCCQAVREDNERREEEQDLRQPPISFNIGPCLAASSPMTVSRGGRDMNSVLSTPPTVRTSSRTKIAPIRFTPPSGGRRRLNVSQSSNASVGSTRSLPTPGSVRARRMRRQSNIWHVDEDLGTIAEMSMHERGTLTEDQQ